MAKGKQTPRQKMINLMYLVFIAMLAMQIDQEIIRSYQDTNQSLTDSRTLAEKKNDIFELTLKQKADNSPETFGLANQQYQGMKSKADDLVGFIESFKGQLKTEAGFDANKTVEDNFSSLNNTDAVTNKFFKGGDAELPSNNSEELKTRMTALQNYIIQNFTSLQDEENLKLFKLFSDALYKQKIKICNAYLNQGEIYENGYFVNKDDKKALSIYKEGLQDKNCKSSWMNSVLTSKIIKLEKK